MWPMKFINLFKSSIIKEEDKLIDAVLLNPILIQRPILVGENKAFIVRPPARIEDIINSFI